MLLVLTDHGNGMAMGPNSDTNPFEAVQNNGAGAQVLITTSSDRWLAMLLGHTKTGAYTDDMLVNHAILEAAGLARSPVQVAAGIVLIGTGVDAFAALRCRRRAP